MPPLLSAEEIAERSGWLPLLRDENALVCVTIAGGVAIHALSMRVVATALPSVVTEIGGLSFFARTRQLLLTLNAGTLVHGISDPNLYRLSGEGITKRTLCRSDGSYSFSGLPSGNWLVIVSTGVRTQNGPAPKWLSREVQLPPNTAYQADISS
jgi:hypothetical protein